MVKILVLIDNDVLLTRLNEIFLKHNRYDVHFDFRRSAGDNCNFRDKFNIEQIEIASNLESIISEYNLIISAHCLQFFPKKLVQSVRCINIHPGYNPINRGWYPQVFSIINDLPIGATIHEMDEKLDHGPIIARKFVDKYVWDTSLTIYNRILDAEVDLFDQYFNQIIENSYVKITPENEGNMFKKADFQSFCQIDMDHVGTFREFYNLLRALSHGNYNNAYFYSKEGQKIFIKIEVENQEQ